MRIPGLVTLFKAAPNSQFRDLVSHGNKELLARLNEGLAIVIASGTYNDLYDKWLGPVLPKPGLSLVQTVKYTILILVPVLLLMAGISLWYMKKQVAEKTRILREEVRERKQAELTLQQSETKFRTLFNVAAVPLCFVDSQGVILDFNPKFTQLFGYTTRDIPSLDQWWVLAYPDPDYRQWVVETWEAAVRKAEENKTDIEPVEYRVTCKNGDIRRVVISGSVFQDYFLATFVDLTDLHQAEERFERFFSLIPDIFCIVDFNGFFRLINPAAQTLLGFTEKELVGTPIFDHVHPADKEKTLAVIHKKLARGKAVNSFLNRLICRDESVLWLEWNFHPVPSQGIAYAAARDFTRHREMEEALKKSELWMRNIYNSLEEAVLVVSPLRSLLHVNRATQDMFGYSEAEIRDQSTRILHVDDAHYDKFGRIIQAAFDQGQTAEFEFRVKRKTGEIFPSEHTVSLLKDEAGTPLGIVSVIRDISERKEAEQQLRDALTDLERSNSELQQFAYVASHDLQEPLRAAVGFMQLLQRRYADKLDAKADHYIQRAVAAGVRMQTLINDLLTLSRANTRSLSPEFLDLSPLVSDTIDTLRTAISEKKAIIRMGTLPRARVDKNQIQGLFQNLIMNALKYNDAPVPEIDIGCETRADVFRFHVSDNGIGIAPEFHEKIFLIFQRLHPNSTYSGSGIGLALCKKIVQRHGGAIWVDSEVGRGTIVYFTLPRTD